ncbi:MAG: bifunctional phosphopantothenoylcysteine decarboxylase/phosphopantothenate--cysteine ligase CoaBC [Deltaproteobacteria bacterium]|nr:bifunctional phosphopantothenoylcysteine decarboxylase/phosphopantothenate--cysteine ligase CoaBC [Deltaproteobacteria bacterium]
MPTVFAGKNIVIGVTGSIAAFKVAGWVSTLAKEEANVSVILTESGSRFVTPLTFSALSGNKTYGSMFDDRDDPMVHITLGQNADIMLIAPATANTIARLANGIADDLLTTTALVTRAEILICPAMNSRMYSHQMTRENIAKLKAAGYQLIDPAHGMMACKDEGEGRLAEWEDVVEYMAKSLTPQDLSGKKVLVTAGPTREHLDPARFLSNRSSGKMGYAMASAAFRRGAEVTLVSGPSTLSSPAGVATVSVESAEDMYNAVIGRADSMDIIVKSAAVADYRPAETARHKVKKEQIEGQLLLSRNRDILFELGRKKGEGQILVGFAAESQHLHEAGKSKLLKKNLDLIAVNDISGNDTGFESGTNQVLLISAKKTKRLPHTSKEHTADLIWDEIVLQ